MSWSNWFKKAPQKAQVSTNRVEELANNLQRENRGHEIETELNKFRLQDLNEKERESLYHLRGILAMRRGEWTIALARFKEAAELFPESNMIRFSLAQEHERRGEAGKAFELFDQCSFPQMPAQWALVQAHYAYLWNYPERGAAYVRPIFDAYFKLGIIDDHFLYVRRLPFFGQAWRYMACFAWEMGDFGKLTQLTGQATEKLKDYNFEEINLFLAALQKADFDPIRAHLRSRLENQPGQQPLLGFPRMQLAALNAETEQSFTVAEKYITTAQVEARDFPWLEDVRLILLAKLNHRHQRAEEETKLRQQFLEKQKMLFEPEHAVSFFILDYQELLKKEYQERRRF